MLNIFMEEEDTAHSQKPWWKTINVKTLTIAVVIVLLLLVLVRYFLSSSQEVSQLQPSSIQPSLSVSSSPQNTEDWVKGQIMVKFKDTVSDAQISQRLKAFNAKIKNKISGINVTVVEVPVGQEAAVMESLSKDPIVKYAEPDYIQKVNWVPNDTYYKNQWGLINTGQTIKNKVGKANADIKVQQAWDVTRGNGVKIAVLDTGLDMSHPDLASKVVAQKVFTTSSINDKFGHGTHVAGIAAAITNNGQGIAGACPDCQLMIGKIMGDNGTGEASAMAGGITWAADNGAKVINISGGGANRSSTQEEAIIYAWNKGVVIVAAAGNENTNKLFYPAALTNVISVAASGNSDTKASFSNYGTWVNVAAPGEAIYSTMPTKAYVMQNSSPLALNYDYLSGTSMASPMVAGVAGLVWASAQGTSATNVARRVIDTADKIGGTGQYWESGRVNAAGAVGTATNPSAAPSVAPSIGPSPSGTAPTLVVPTFGCMGSPSSICPTLPPTQAPGSPSTTPSGPVASQGPVPSGVSINPSEPSGSPSNPGGGGGGGRRGDRPRQEGLIKQFIRFLLQLILLIIGRLFGGGNQSFTISSDL